MMLWYKAWRETRTRFLASGVTLAWVCVVILVLQQQSRLTAHLSYSGYIWSAIYKDYVRDLYIALTILLAGGTLTQEREHGTAGFTLALPVTRRHLVTVRSALGLAQVVALALVPALLIPALSALSGEPYDTGQPLRFFPLWACCGVVIFGLAHLVATVVRGVATSWLCSFLALAVYGAAVNATALSRYPRLSLFRIMNGTGLDTFHRATYSLQGPLPWALLAAIVCLGLALLACSARIVERKDFDSV